MQDTITAIDFETAQGKRSSICQVGLVQYENGSIINELELLIQPPNNEYFWKNTEIHGISAKDTFNSPTFDKAWPKIAPFIINKNVVAHNGSGFDFPVLSKTLEYYGIETPEYNKHCTFQLFGQDLASLCHRYKIKLNHHNALSDARACAKLYFIYLERERFLKKQ